MVVTGADALASVPLLPSMYDEPFADSSQIPTYLVSKLARGQVVVSLSGDGGDELFGGYTRYGSAAKIWSALSSLPDPVRGAASTLISMAPERILRALDRMTASIPRRLPFRN